MAARVSKALSMYKTILRRGRSWPEVEEREYIDKEAKRLFRQNRDLTSTEYAILLIFDRAYSFLIYCELLNNSPLLSKGKWTAQNLSQKSKTVLSIW